EADRMLDLGFSVDIAKILALLPKKRQNLLFSATFSSDIRALTGKLLKNPVRIEASPRNSAAQGVRQYIYEVDKGKKSRLLCHLLRNKGQGQALVFVRTREGADRLTRELHRAQIEAAAIHGDKSQGQRTATLDDFKGGAIQVLVATDVAARGIDIHDLPLVVNLDLPKVAEDYIHRIGRTGRAGLQGEAISLVSADEAPLLANIEALLRKLLPREIETGFVPTHPVPLTQLTKTKAKKPKKPKQKPAAQQRTGETFPRDGKTRPGEEAKAAGRRQPPRGRDRQPRKSAAPKTNRGGRNN
ncbi:MAG: helicase-related protein, partial [Desulfobulbaceae bacterium]|nr:helicase-related protein [Desulfobulbaceae bacterium]